MSQTRNITDTARSALRGRVLYPLMYRVNPSGRWMQDAQRLRRQIHEHGLLTTTRSILRARYGPEPANEEATEQEQLMGIAEAAGIDIPPTPSDPRTCSHAWGFALNPDIVPDWLIEATWDKIQAPEVPGVPQVFRTDGYIDWAQLIADHPDELEIVHEWTPTARCLEIVEELRERGYDASVTGQVYLQRTRDDGALVFGIEAADVITWDPNADEILRAYEDDIRDAFNVVPEHQRAHLEFMERYGTAPAAWGFC